MEYIVRKLSSRNLKLVLIEFSQVSFPRANELIFTSSLNVMKWYLVARCRFLNKWKVFDLDPYFWHESERVRYL
jgi:hypothetical protein